MYLLFLFPPLPIFVAVLAYVYQLRAADRLRHPGGGGARAARGTLHGLSVIGLGVTCPLVFELTATLHPRALGLALGALFAVASFVLALTLADKGIDYVLANFVARSNEAERLTLRQIARLELPDAVAFSTLMLAWTAIEVVAP